MCYYEPENQNHDRPNAVLCGMVVGFVAAIPLWIAGYWIMRAVMQ